jgi:hypothetical protein
MPSRPFAISGHRVRDGHPATSGGLRDASPIPSPDPVPAQDSDPECDADPLIRGVGTLNAFAGLGFVVALVAVCALLIGGFLVFVNVFAAVGDQSAPIPAGPAVVRSSGTTP